jgi:DNA replicative helicase MCM subunit Mcm2 (Cdc46/Mcm family)
MRNLNPGVIDQLITICSMFIRTSQLKPERQEDFFHCQVYVHTTLVEMD